MVEIMRKESEWSMETKRIYRSDSNRVLAGVCGGVGEYFNIDPIIVRIVWVVFTFMGGAGILGYLVAWVVIPARNSGGQRSIGCLSAILIFLVVAVALAVMGFVIRMLLGFTFALPFIGNF